MSILIKNKYIKLLYRIISYILFSWVLHSLDIFYRSCLTCSFTDNLQFYKFTFYFLEKKSILYLYLYVIMCKFDLKINVCTGSKPTMT